MHAVLSAQCSQNCNPLWSFGISGKHSKWLTVEHGINAIVKAWTIANCFQNLITSGFITDQTRSDDRQHHRLLWMKCSHEAHRNQCLQVLLKVGSNIMQLRPSWGKNWPFKLCRLHYMQQLFPDDWQKEGIPSIVSGMELRLSTVVP